MNTRIEALRDEHCYIASVDVCGHCGDSECDGIGCIARLNPDDAIDHEGIEYLHDRLRYGQAWQVMQAVLDAGESVETAHALAVEALTTAGYLPPHVPCLCPEGTPDDT